MKFGGFKLGKKDKAATQEESIAEEPVDQIEAIVQDVEPVSPHAPLQELSLDAENENAAPEILMDGEPAAPAEEEGEPVKLVEVQPDTMVASIPPPAPLPEIKKDEPKKDPMDLGASIGNIFDNIEDEENPLANLIKVLPDVAATELIDDLKEINDIIKDWQKK
jgi:hypothetical protein